MGVYIPNMEKPKGCGECELWSNCFYPKNPYTEQDDYIADDCPLIDIDLVRCGECKWYNPWHANHTNIDGNHCRNIDRPMKPTDFCSYGERRAEDFNPYQGERDRDENGEIY